MPHQKGPRQKQQQKNASHHNNPKTCIVLYSFPPLLGEGVFLMHLAFWLLCFVSNCIGVFNYDTMPSHHQIPHKAWSRIEATAISSWLLNCTHHSYTQNSTEGFFHGVLILVFLGVFYSDSMAWHGNEMGEAARKKNIINKTEWAVEWVRRCCQAAKESRQLLHISIK